MKSVITDNTVENNGSRRILITCMILLALLILSMIIPFGDLLSYILVQQGMHSTVDLVGKVTNWSYVFFYSGGLIPLAIVLWINRDDPARLNIDRFYAILLVIVGFMVIWYFTWLAWLSGLAAVFVIYLLMTGKIKFEPISSSTWWFSLLGLLVFVIAVITFHYSINSASIKKSLDQLFLTMAGSIFEEMIFRGLLWGYLRDHNFKPWIILIVQTAIFMIAHINYIIFDPLWFWLWVPIIGMFLGLIVWRTKSIAPSAIWHILINIGLGLF